VSLSSDELSELPVDRCYVFVRHSYLAIDDHYACLVEVAEAFD